MMKNAFDENMRILIQIAICDCMMSVLDKMQKTE